MRSLALFAPLLVAGSSLESLTAKTTSFSVTVSSSASASQQSSSSAPSPSSPLVASSSVSKSGQSGQSASSSSVIASSSIPKSQQPASASVIVTASDSKTASMSTPSLRFTSISPVTTISRNFSRPSITLNPSLNQTGSFNVANQTIPTSSSTPVNIGDDDGKTSTGPCTGCAIQAFTPSTTWFNTADSNNPWTSLVVTETVITETITYLDGSTIDTIATETNTYNQTKTVALGPGDQIITRTTPRFVIEPTAGVRLTVDAGPTYVMYNNLWGDLDKYSSEVFDFFDGPITYETCAPNPTQLSNWQPTKTEDWSHLIMTFTPTAPDPGNTFVPVTIPPEILDYLKYVPAIKSVYNGSDIATCTVYPTHGGITEPVPEEPTKEPFIPPLTSTYLSTTYESTSRHVTRAGCMRECNEVTMDLFGPKPTRPNLEGPTTTVGRLPPPETVVTIGTESITIRPGEPTQGPSQTNQDPGRPNQDPGQPNQNPSQPNQNPDRPDQNPGQPNQNPNQPNQNPNQPNQNPGQPNQNPGQMTSLNGGQGPPVIVGTNTLTAGQSTNINGVPVVVPSDGGGSQVVVGGTTIQVPQAPSAVPILTVGGNTVTANPQGQFVVGTETLIPGGSAVTVDGSTLSLGPSGNIAIVNGVTQTLANLPIITAPPAITVGGRVVSATVLGGTTQLVLGDKTLAPGNAITVDGTTYSLPSDAGGTAVVVNGVTSTIASSPAGLVLGAQSITANIRDGTTAFVFSPGQTLTPGGVVTVSGTTFSMPASASGSVVVVNGVTSTLNRGPVVTAAAALTLNGKTYAATVRDGTTEFVLAPGTTLRPGEQLTVDGTTYSLDKEGTALVVNGRTSTIPRLPASNSARTTSSSASARDVGNFVWSGIGGGGGGQSSSSKADGNSVPRGGLDKWVESIIIGIAGWAAVFI